MVNKTETPLPVKTRILVVEDEQQIARFLELELIHEGYAVTRACDGMEALIQVRSDRPDLVVLDLMIPGIEGLEVCRRLRAGNDTRTLPVIMVTAKDTIADRVNGLKTGADDYLTKPFSIEELLARIDALLRRANTGHNIQGERLAMGDLVVYTAMREVQRGNQSVALTTKEYDLLLYLLRHPNCILSREQIYDAVWGFDFEGESNVIEVYIRHLRTKLDTYGPKLIHTVRGVGYMLHEG